MPPKSVALLIVRGGAKVGAARFSLLAGAVALSIWLNPSQAAAQQQANVSEINSCRYLVVPEYREDTWGFQPEVRRQGQALGFVIVADQAGVPTNDVVRACAMLTTQFPNGIGGGGNDFRVQVVDLVSGARLGEASAGTTMHLSVSGAVKARVQAVYRKLGYRGFSEEAVTRKVARLYPPRPKVAVSEDEIRRREVGSAIEGIWSDPEDRYRIGIVSAPKESGTDYYAVILKSATPVWQPGEIKGELRGTASPAVFTSTWFMLGKNPVGTTFMLESGVLRATVNTTAPAPGTEVVFLKVWPAVSASPGAAATRPSGAGPVMSAGTAFAVSADGLLLTAFHVVEGAGSISAKCGSSPEAPVTVVARSSALDLAVLRMPEAKSLAYLDLVPETEMPELGTFVFTVGFPATRVLGTDPKYTEGTISGLSGLEGDASFYQVSVPIQPGNSGGPLLDERGRVVGVILATASAPAFLRTVGTLPQNINWAVKGRVATTLFKAAAPRPAAGSRQEAIKRATSAVCMIVASKN